MKRVPEREGSLASQEILWSRGLLGAIGWERPCGVVSPGGIELFG
jgi:hypothetical protein